jgi:hypothetical protein
MPCDRGLEVGRQVDLAVAVGRLFGITDYLISMPGWEAAKKDAPQGEPRPGTLASAYKDYVDSLERSRNIGLFFSLLCLVGGLGLGIGAGRAYFRRRPAAGVPSGPGGRDSAVAVCNICGAKLSPGQEVRGLCDFCRRRAG